MTKIFLVLFILLAIKAEAQLTTTDPYTKFTHSFILGRSSESRTDSILVSSNHFMTDKGCIQTMCLIKVEVDSLKRVRHMELSDSADSLFRKRFAEKQHFLDIRSLENYLQVEFANSSSRVFMIPFSYFIYTETCPSEIPLHILKNYNKFQGFGHYGTMLKPIGFDVIIQR